MRCRLTSLCLPAVHVNPIRWEVAVAIDCWLFSLWIVGLCTCTSCIQANVHLNNTRIETNLLKTTLPFFSTFWITRTLVNTDVFGQSTEVRVNEVLLYNFKAPFLGTGNIIVLSDCIVILRIYMHSGYRTVNRVPVFCGCGTVNYWRFRSRKIPEPSLMVPLFYGYRTVNSRFINSFMR